MELTSWDKLLVELILNEGKQFELTLEGDHINKKEVNCDHLQAVLDFNYRNILIQVCGGSCYVSYNKGKFYTYASKKITIFLGSISYVKNNNTGGPVLRINNKNCENYKDISLAVFGKIKKTSEVKEFISAYYTKPKFDIGQFNLNDFELLSTGKCMGQYYPVIFHKGVKYKGVTGLRSLINNKRVIDQILDHIGWDVEKNNKRHEELTKKFDLEKEGSNYVLTDPKTKQDHTFPSQRKVIEYIQSCGETLSRATAQKMFQSL